MLLHFLKNGSDYWKKFVEQKIFIFNFFETTFKLAKFATIPSLTWKQQFGSGLLISFFQFFFPKLGYNDYGEINQKDKGTDPEESILIKVTDFACEHRKTSTHIISIL